jgi:hypothetical protein
LIVAQLFGVAAMATDLSTFIADDGELRLVDLSDLDLIGVPVFFCALLVGVSDCKDCSGPAPVAKRLAFGSDFPEKC